MDGTSHGENIWLAWFLDAARMRSRSHSGLMNEIPSLTAHRSTGWQRRWSCAPEPEAGIGGFLHIDITMCSILDDEFRIHSSFQSWVVMSGASTSRGINRGVHQILLNRPTLIGRHDPRNGTWRALTRPDGVSGQMFHRKRSVKPTGMISGRARYNEDDPGKSA